MALQTEVILIWVSLADQPVHRKPRLVDEEIKEIIAKAYKRAKISLLRTEKLDELAEYLLEKERSRAKSLWRYWKEKPPDCLTVQRKALIEPQSCLPFVILSKNTQAKQGCFLVYKTSYCINQNACQIYPKQIEAQNMSGCRLITMV